ncbi:MarR family winged helix-turn-helix transcriptional regulator [Ruania halotolerans]|uniref:MarR family winged helix-turn-helix transcriptional regulator n=1 Tax=Ruania halotolerans TaxID=2897773 RepID=UPI001E5CE3F2|nr:MarR family transcriptional regulator [Ruania halotolerans]UFU05828.1 MarR family transcriptional regulator [Ruania halotolerans]
MTQPRWLDQEQQRYWRSLLEGCWSLFEALGHDLEEAADLSMNEYEVLVRLSESEDRSLRMSHLADQVVSSRSRLTHTVRRMEAAGLVERRSNCDDGRGVDCVLTDSGYARLVEAAPAHVESVRRRLVDQLSPEQLKTVGEAFERITAEIDAEREGR